MTARFAAFLRSTGWISLLLVLFFHGMAFGQADRATLTGHVTDPSGTVLQGVSVVATATATGTLFNGMTNGAGAYTIPALPIGGYTVALSHAGFQNVQSTVHLVATAVQTLDVTLTVGSGNQTVSVSAAPQHLEQETSSVANTLEQEALRDLPLDATMAGMRCGLW